MARALQKPQAYYNENDPKAAAWLRELIKRDLIAPGIVDERDIRDVLPSELSGFTQCHFFAGVGVWSYSLRQAGWPDDRPVWTGSCPCQPFSAAGKGNGFDDERHLWPSWFHLIQIAKPEDVPVFGEQVASKDGLAWLDLVQADLEGTDHACWPIDQCAASIGSPNIRQRLYWFAQRLANPDIKRLEGRFRMPERVDQLPIGQVGLESGVADTSKSGCNSGAGLRDSKTIRGRKEPANDSCDIRLDHAERHRRNPRGEDYQKHDGNIPDTANTSRRLANSHSNAGPTNEREQGQRSETQEDYAPIGNCADIGSEGPCPTNGFWGTADWLFCTDGKWRPVEPGTFPLAHGAPARVVRLRGYGNAINAEQATIYIEAVMDTLDEFGEAA